MSHLAHHSPSPLCEQQTHPSSCSGQRVLEPSWFLPFMPYIQSVSKSVSSTFKILQILTLLTTSPLQSKPPVISQLDYCTDSSPVPLSSFTCPSHSRNPLKTHKSDTSPPLLTTSSGFLSWPLSDGPQGAMLFLLPSLQLPPVPGDLASPALLTVFQICQAHSVLGLFLCLGCFFAWNISGLAPSLASGLLKCYLISNVFPGHLNSNSTLCSHFLSPLPALFFSQHVSPCV